MTISEEYLRLLCELHLPPDSIKGCECTAEARMAARQHSPQLNKFSLTTPFLLPPSPHITHSPSLPHLAPPPPPPTFPMAFSSTSCLDCRDIIEDIISSDTLLITCRQVTGEECRSSGCGTCSAHSCFSSKEYANKPFSHSTRRLSGFWGTSGGVGERIHAYARKSPFHYTLTATSHPF